MQKGTPPSRVELLPAQRHGLILEHLRRSTAASIQDLADRLGASISTVRRDLLFLTEQGYLDRTHGGAVIRRTPAARFEPEPSIAAEMFRAEKEAIGVLAATRIRPGQSVLLDASSTVHAAARVIAGLGLAVTAVTNDLRCAAILACAPGIQTIVTGGTIRPGSATLVGEPARSFLGSVHVDIAFIGVHTISGTVLTETSLEVAGMKRLMIASARQIVVLADSGKFAPPSFCEICPVAEVDEVITDAGATDEQVGEVRAAGTLCTVAPLAAQDE